MARSSPPLGGESSSPTTEESRRWTPHARAVSFALSDLIVETLTCAGVRNVYGIPGDSLNGFTDALRRDRSIAWQHVRHEEAAAFAAADEAAITGELAVCAASCGPGNLHLINGLYAQRSRVPVVAVAAHIGTREIGANYFRETHPWELFGECGAYCELVTSTRQLPYVLDIAVRTAVEQKDVAVLVLPRDVLLQERPFTRDPSRAVHCSASDPELEAAAHALNAAERLTILAGAGCADAHGEVLAFGPGSSGPHGACPARQGSSSNTTTPGTSV
jgi:pyruvate dehydrogenase (quinone)